MIVGLSGTVELPNIEHMLITFQAVEGEGPIKTVHLYREELTPEQQATYDAAVGLVGDFNRNVINNTTSFMDIARMTSTVLQEGKEVKDFLTDFTAQEQDQLRAFLALVIELSE